VEAGLLYDPSLRANEGWFTLSRETRAVYLAGSELDALAALLNKHDYEDWLERNRPR
jgi:hypothetical protein